MSEKDFFTEILDENLWEFVEKNLRINENSGNRKLRKFYIGEKSRKITWEKLNTA